MYISHVLCFNSQNCIVRAKFANEYVIAPSYCNFFPPTMPNPNVNSLKKENESLKSEIAAPKKNFEEFQNSLKFSVNDANVSNNGGEVSRLAISQDETLNTL